MNWRFLLCLLGVHGWKPWSDPRLPNQVRQCRWCNRVQVRRGGGRLW